MYSFFIFPQLPIFLGLFFFILFFFSFSPSCFFKSFPPSFGRPSAIPSFCFLPSTFFFFSHLTRVCFPHASTRPASHLLLKAICCPFSCWSCRNISLSRHLCHDLVCNAYTDIYVLLGGGLNCRPICS